MNKNIKLFFVSDGHGQIHSHTLVKYLLKLNYDIDIFFWKKFFHKYTYSSKKYFYFYLILSKIENKIIFGPIIFFINFLFILKAISKKYDIIFLLRGTHISSFSIFVIKKITSVIFISYNNDDPFSKLAESQLWKNYKSSIKYMDHCFVYRYKNIQEHLNLGCKNSSLLRSYFVPEFNFKIDKKNIPLQFINDVIFAGHYEDDNRDKILLFLLKRGIKLKIFGSEWERSIYYHELINLQGKIYELNQNDYNLALNGSKIALVFLSKINNDTYTRRCFVIMTISLLNYKSE